MQTSTAVATPDVVDAQRESFLNSGYLVVQRVVDGRQLADLTGRIRGEFERVKSSGQLFAGGGTLSGHLNCFPGAASRFVLDQLQAAGIIDLIRALSETPLRAPNIGCNLNLPRSSAQNEHVDGYAAQPFLVANVACVDTNLDNGAMEILAGTHHTDSKYWRILLKHPERLRLTMKQGDVLIRPSNLWHRGMPNHSRDARPMLAFTWEDGGSQLEDPYAVHQGQITFLPNRYQTDWASRLCERAFVALPTAGAAFRAVRSLF